MNILIGVILSLLACIQATEITDFVPIGKENIYDYKAVIRTGTIQPAPYVSEYCLSAKLHVQGGNKESYVYLTDIKYTLHNGEHKNMWDHDWASAQLIPAEANDLLLPFQVKYNATGKVDAMATEKNDKLWSRNMKQAISALLQLDMELVDADTHPYSNYTEEETIYGRCKVHYNVIPSPGKVIVEKMQDSMSCLKETSLEWMQPHPLLCRHMINPMTLSQTKEYVVTREGKNAVFDHIESIGTIFGFPFQGESEVFFSQVNQTLDLVETVDIKTPVTFLEQIWVRTLKYNEVDETLQTGSAFDYTQGRMNPKLDEVMIKMQKLLTEVYEYMQLNNVNMKVPDTYKTHTINHLVLTLTKFDLLSLEHCFGILNAKQETEKDRTILKIFLEVIPKVGTKPCVLFTRNLIRKQKVNEDTASKMLQSLPFFIRKYSKKLLTEMEELMDLKLPVTSEVYKAGVLAFATMVNKALQSKSCSEEEKYKENLEKYVEHYMDKLQAATIYEEKVVWMEGLHNMESEIATKLLIPIITGKEKVSEDLRSLAIWGSVKTVGRKEAAALYWPILTDRTQSLHIRVLAYCVLMTAFPDMSTFSKINEVIMKEVDNSLYNFHYTTLQSLTRTKHPCYKDMGLLAKRLLKIILKPKKVEWTNGNYMFDYVDKKYGFGSFLHTVIINSEKTITLYLQTETQFENMAFGFDSVLIRFHKPTTDEHEIPEIPPNSNEESVNRIISALIEYKYDVEIIEMKNHKVIMTYKIVTDSTEESVDKIQKWINPNKDVDDKDIIDLDYMYSGGFIIPNDLGLPISTYLEVPIAFMLKYDYKKEIKSPMILNLHNEFSFKVWSHSSYGIDVYNPINDMWHGIFKLHSIDFSIPMNFDFLINKEMIGTYKVTFNKWKPDEVFGIQNHVKSQVYIYGDKAKELLKMFNPKSKTYENVSKGKEFKKEIMLLDKELYSIGKRLQVNLFDCERPVSKGSVMTTLQNIVFKHMQSNTYTPIEKCLIIAQNWFDYLLAQPTTGSCGFTMRMIDSVEKPADHIDIMFRLDGKPTLFSNSLSPAMKLNTRLTSTVKGAVDKKVLYTLDTLLVLELEKGQTDNKIDMMVTETIPGIEPLQMHVISEKMVDTKGVLRNMNITFTKAAKSSFIDIKIKGEMSDEQKKLEKDKTLMTYENCMVKPTFYRSYLPKYHNLKCDIEQTSLHKYTYDITVSDTECPYIRTLMWLKEVWRVVNSPYYQPVTKPGKGIGPNHIRFEVDYAVDKPEVDVMLTTPTKTYSYVGVPIMFTELENIHYTSVFMWLYNWGLVNTCTVDLKSVVHDKWMKSMPFEATPDWTLYMRDTLEKPMFAIYAKMGAVPNTMAMKLVIGINSMEITPKGTSYEFMMNNKVMPMPKTGYHTDTWVAYKFIPTKNTIMISTLEHNVYIHYDGMKISISFPNLAMYSLTGKCFMKLN